MADPIYTIGCSAHPVEYFVELLNKHGIRLVADVRSVPYSRLHPQFNREPLSAVLGRAGIAYEFFGEELGARSGDPACYTDGKVQYERIAETDIFREGLERLRREAQNRRAAVMCAEKEPIECHRTILVARRLVETGSDVVHILADGATETHAEAMSRLLQKLHIPEFDLFRSREEALDEAYRVQGETIAYENPEDHAAEWPG